MRTYAMHLPDTPDLGAIVRSARAVARMTQAEVGARCGYSRSVISRIETGAMVPDWITVCRLAEVLDIPADALGPRERTVPVGTPTRG